MAKTNGNTESTVDNDESGTVELTPAQKAERRALFEKYTKLDADVTAADAAVIKAQAKRTEVVLAIIAAYGNGPFAWKGDELTATKRDKKDGTTVGYFRGKSNTEAVEI